MSDYGSPQRSSRRMQKPRNTVLRVPVPFTVKSAEKRTVASYSLPANHPQSSASSPSRPPLQYPTIAQSSPPRCTVAERKQTPQHWRSSQRWRPTLLETRAHSRDSFCPDGLGFLRGGFAFAFVSGGDFDVGVVGVDVHVARCH